MKPNTPIERRALDVLAKHFTEEDVASTVERQVGRFADAILGTIET